MVAPSILRMVGRITRQPTRSQTLVLTTIIWAGIYLPGLGSVELWHEEPRRALPAVHMLASGDWLVPRVGSIPFLRKPPMLYWLIALSFWVTGTRSEWAVRLPSALAVLALALTICGIGSHWLGPNGAFFAAILFLTNFMVLENGRLAELEAVYVASSGVGLLFWIAAWLRGARGWSLWFLPAIFLAFAMLTKGPTHLLFFYGVVLPTLFFADDLRTVRHPAHWCALGLIVGLFAAWAVPCSLAVGENDPIGVWRFWIHEITSRAGGSGTGHFHLATWLLSFPSTLKNFLPWTPLLFFLWRDGRSARPAKFFESTGNPVAVGSDAGSTRTIDMGPVPALSEARLEAWFRGARWGMVATCVLMSLLPFGSPRYLYPLFVVPCLLLAQALIEPRGTPFRSSTRIGRRTLKFWRAANLLLLLLTAVAALATPFFSTMNFAAWIGLFVCALLCIFGWIASREVATVPDSSGNFLPLAVTTAAAFMIAMLVYAIAIVPRVNSLSYGAREVASAIRARLPPDAILWIHEDQYGPFWYYLDPMARYFLRTEQIPPNARYVILPSQISATFIRDERWKDRPFRMLSQIMDNEKNVFELLERQPENAK